MGKNKKSKVVCFLVHVMQCLIIPDIFMAACCYAYASPPSCGDVLTQEEATDGIKFCYIHQFTLYE